MNAPRRTVLVAVVAVLGIAIAAAITWGTSQLVRQRIGLASEPLTAGRRLLPPVTSTPVQRTPAPVTHPPKAPATSTSTRPQSAPAPASTGAAAPATTTAAPRSALPPPVTSTPARAPSGTRSAQPADETPVHPGPTIRGSQDGGGDQSAHRDD